LESFELIYCGILALPDKEIVKIAYLLNTYPLPSTTFIRREIHALERQGVVVERFAARSWEGELIDPADKLEKDKTKYLLEGNIASLIVSTLKQACLGTSRFLQAFSVMYALWSAGGGIARHFAYLMQAIYFAKKAKQLEIKHVHAHFATNATAICLLSKVLGGPTYSFTVHGPDEFVDSSKLNFPLKVGGATFVSAISFYCRSQIALAARLNDLSKIVIVRCGLDLNDFPYSKDDVPETHSLVCVGRLCPQKGQVFFPEVAVRLKKDFPNFKLILVGDGEDRQVIERQIDTLNVQDVVYLVGWKSNADVRSAIRASKGLLLPSYAEGLPVVIMEALALGRPVVSTYIAGIPELVTPECGWLVPAGSIDDIEKALRELLSLSMEETQKRGAVGRTRVEEFHDIEKSARVLREKFSKLA
jgi:colanic acid/amylovoran biosynthesis glycosyltransferase